MTFLIIKLFLSLVFGYLALSSLYLFIAALAGRIIPLKKYPVDPVKNRIAILIPSYRMDNIIVDSAIRNKKHDYPPELFEVFVGADSLKPETIERLKRIPVQVLEVSFDTSSKSRTLNQLLNRIPDGSYDIALLLDEDNVMEAGCLEKINSAFQTGFRAVQCHRVAKNMNTASAVLDGVSEEINNHLFRRGMRALGMSSTTIGSGMAFEFDLLKKIYNLPVILGNPACDRVVDFELTRAGYTIEFLEDARVLDEKVTSAKVFERQRTRWMESQLMHLRLFFADQERFHQSFQYWNKFLINLLLPRGFYLVIFSLLVVFLGLAETFHWNLIFPTPGFWLAACLLFFVAFALSIPSSMYNSRTFKASFYAPVLLFSMARAVFKMNTGRKEFLHTPKTYSQEIQHEVNS